MQQMTPTDRLDRLERKVGLPTAADVQAVDRAALVERLTELRAPSPQIDAAVQDEREAEAEIADLESKLKSAKRRKNAAERLRWSLGFSRDREMQTIQTDLMRSARPILRETQAWAERQLADLRSTRPNHRRDESKRKAGQPEGPITHSDVASRDRRYDYLQSVLTGSDSKLRQAAEIVDLDECRAFLEEVRADLPPLRMEPV